MLIYGSYGYTGNLIATMAVDRGLRPTLAGRDEGKLRAQAERLGLECRAFSLDSPAEIAKNLCDMPLVVHCAGPFSHTARVMAQACLETGAHYLDITGEISIFEALAGLDETAAAKNVMLMPGAGFDVVPTDCLALHLRKRLPGATTLRLAFLIAGSTASRGTVKSSIENFYRGALARVNGEIVAAERTVREIDFGRGLKKSVLIPWGDVATAWYSTGIPNIEVYSGSHLPLRPILRLGKRMKWVFKKRPVQRFLQSLVNFMPEGPSANQLDQGASVVWGEVVDADGARCVSRLSGPEPYRFTALTALLIASKVLSGNAPVGFQTPAKAYGPDLILEIDGVTRTDIA